MGLGMEMGLGLGLGLGCFPPEGGGGAWAREEPEGGLEAIEKGSGSRRRCPGAPGVCPAGCACEGQPGLWSGRLEAVIRDGGKVG
jgi:hypothetical protein